MSEFTLTFAIMSFDSKSVIFYIVDIPPKVNSL